MYIWSKIRISHVDILCCFTCMFREFYCLNWAQLRVSGSLADCSGVVVQQQVLESFPLLLSFLSHQVNVYGKLNEARVH
jgi:hypothetical protein